MQNKLDVKMGEFMVAESPIILQTVGIGSCVAVCIYDSKNKVGGLAHIMSPQSKMDETIKPMRFADRAIKMMVESICAMGGGREKLCAKIIGGASMFPKVTKVLAIGAENISAVKDELKKLKVDIIGEDIGGNVGRSIWFDIGNGDIVISKVREETKVL